MHRHNDRLARRQARRRRNLYLALTSRAVVGGAAHSERDLCSEAWLPNAGFQRAVNIKVRFETYPAISPLRRRSGRPENFDTALTKSRNEGFPRSGFSQQYISGRQQGRRNPTIVTLYELAQALDVDFR